MTTERLHELRQLKLMLTETAYHISSQELERVPSGRTKYKED